MSKKYLIAGVFIAGILWFTGCSKGDDGGGNNNPCAGVTILVNGTVVNVSAPGANDGSITVTASGASGFTYKLNNGSFQSSGTFSNLAAGTYAITARSSQGCTAVGSFTVNATDPCAGKTITVTISATTPSNKCSPTGSVTVNASGSTGFVYRLDASGTYQSSNTLNNASAGAHTVYVKDATGCERTANVTVNSLPDGTLFVAVRSLLQSKCAPCHTAQSEGGANYTEDCRIVGLKDRIKARAVDAGDMPQGGPQLTTAEKKIITDWISAGGQTSN